MTKDELKLKLKSARDCQKLLEKDFDERQRLRNLAERMTPVYSNAPRNRSAKNQDGKIVDLVEYDAIIADDMNKLVQALAEARAIINYAGNDRLCLILRMRYLNYYSWSKIASELNYTIKHVEKLHSVAINQILQNMR
ncbi:MAG: hypothetical protein ACI3XH_04790 [Phascolarctobacterium sp.]